MLIRILNGFVLSYSAFVLAWFLFNRFLQDSWWGQVVLDKFAEFFILPAILVFFVALCTRKGSTILISILPVVVCAFFYAPFFWPFKTENAAEAGGGFRVASYNIWNHNKDIDGVVDVINSTVADIVALQEITEEQQPLLVDKLTPTYPYYHISKPIFGGTTALFSRTPLDNVVEIDIQIDRPSIAADVVWNEAVYTVVSAHLNPSFWAYWRQPWKKIPGNYLQYIKDQNKQVEAILNELDTRETSDAHFLACDCNSQETASTNRLLHKYFNEAFRAVGWQLGKTGVPNLQFERKLTHIDYIWYSGDVVPVAVFRGAMQSESDHDPVIADFK